MSREAIGLGAVALALLGSSLGVVLARNLLHSVLWLAAALVATAGLFLLLQAEFLAAVQVLLYTGGVVTIVVFAIMLTERLVGQKILNDTIGLVKWANVNVTVRCKALPQGLIADSGAARMGAMLVDLLYGDPFTTEYRSPFDQFGVRLMLSSNGGFSSLRASGRGPSSSAGVRKRRDLEVPGIEG